MVNGILTRRGYVIKKDDLSDKEFEKIKEDLSVSPSANDEFGKDAVTYEVYNDDGENITVPRYYGIKYFGQPITNEIVSKNVKFKFTKELRDYQVKIVDNCLKSMKDNGGGILSVPCGMGKCLAKGTQIMMSDGSIKLVEDVKIGDLLMGDDSKPRKVLSLARGKEEMFDIIPTKGEKYTVNRSHILSLKYHTIKSVESFTINGIKYNNGDIVDISVDDYLKLPSMYHGKESPLKGFRVPIDFDSKQVDDSPYALGLWLGDGNPERWDENKYIPDLYKYNSRDIRLQLLAGIIDGNLNKNTDGYDIYLESEKLIDDVIYLCRSLGFAAYKSCTISKNGTYYKTTIYGNDLEKIPILRHRKSTKDLPGNSPENLAKNPLLYNIYVMSIGEGDYYGFEIDGNKRFVLGDFSVTHNTTMALYMACALGLKTLVVVHKSFLQDQWYDRAQFFTNARIGLIRSKKKDVKHKDIVIGMIHSISMIDYDMKLFDEFGLVIYDECHHVAARIFSKALYKTGANYTLGLSATPYRGDGLTKVINWYLGDMMYRETKKINKLVVAKIFNYQSDSDLFVEKKRWVAGKIRPFMPTMITNLTLIPERNKFIIDIINNLRKYPERKTLILSGRIDHLEYLKNEVDKYIKEEEEKGIILENECKTYYYIGKLKQAQRREAEQNADILFASYAMAEEGLDIDRLNTIILATPQKNVEQAVGRIMRKILKKEDTKPLIIDIADYLSRFKEQSKRRLKQYTDGKYQIKEYYVQDDKLISYTDHLKNKYGYTEKEIQKNITDNPNKIYDPDISKILFLDNDDCEENDNNSDDKNECINDNQDEQIVVKGKEKGKGKKKYQPKYDDDAYLFDED
ncbi:MAG: superfamily II DNA or RNA helicase [Edafosvirus sp.]|uniref:Superfamily II DNA or RNA helicase n=1 Tax=Edafosvirus sp. TaxID=2487765 RepID=A0A3G4ZXG9_9VIRU|nr:MAG: superfamily II DNA or RNA helicase [Edafosvirus sp.]